MREKAFILSQFSKLLRLSSGRVKVGRDGGYTLIELVLAVAVSSVILTAAVLSIYSILVTTVRSANQTVSLTDINRAALAIKNDLLMTQTTDLADGVPSSSANLSWIDYTSSFGTSPQTEYSARYDLSGKELRRTDGQSGNVTIVGRNITFLSFTRSGKSVTVVLSSSNTTLPSDIETIQFNVHLRAEEIE